MQKLLTPPRAAKHPDTVTHARPRTHRRICLAARRQLAGGDARSRHARPGHPRLSRSRERLFRRHRWPTRRRCRRRSSRRCAGASRRTIPPSPPRTAPGPISCATSKAASIRCFVREKREGGGEEVLLDGNALAEGHAYFGSAAPRTRPTTSCSPGRTTTRARSSTRMSIRDLASGNDIADTIADTSRRLRLVGRRPLPLLRPARRQPPPLARLPPHARHEPRRRRARLRGARSRLLRAVGKTQSDRFIVIHAHDHQTAEARIIPADDPLAEPLLVAPRETGVEYDLDEAHGTFFILTNAGGAEDFKIVTAPVASPGRENWTDLVPHEPGRLILSHMVFARHLVRLERIDGLPRIVVGAWPTAKSTSSPSTRRPTRSGLPAATSSTPTRCASPIPR